ncbi:helix-turn-helix transcriptional regulator [Devosia sp. A16]|uniref:helix-turn-helix transcriptional regulator n=1 Tax=Devosia sp. A16 TaxID=1736675 RepID=UPI0006D7766F|nr:helix-turn-helix transcriptional regulator [Devosia sp. A16]
MADDDLIDRIYEAGAVPELWPVVLEELAGVGQVSGTVLFAVREQAVHWTSSAGLYEMSKGYFDAGYPARDDRTARLLAYDHPGFVTDLDVFTREEWEADPIRREYFVPRGYGWGVATGVKVPTGDLLIFHGERHLEDGPVERAVVERLDLLRPHLARAALMSARIAFARAQGTVSAMEMVGLPAAVLGARGAAIATNSLLERLNPAVVLSRPDRLGFTNTGADRILVAALQATEAGLHQGLARSIPIPAAEGGVPMVAHLLPIRASAREVFTGAAAILLMTPVGPRELPDVAVIQGLFDLSPAEARVARALGSGMTIAQIATTTGASVATVRNQVQAVFDKTGMHRQAELVGLLRGAFTPS